MLEVEDVVKRFDPIEVLRGVSLSVAPGQVYGLLGGNGAGKSTLVNIVVGLLAADGGRVEVAGERSARRRRRRIGLATQEEALYPVLTCEENLRFFGRLFGGRGAALTDRVNRTVELAGLGEYRDTPVSSLSGGWRRRLNLAVAMVHGPPLLLLDEPTAGLDVEARHQVWRNIEHLRNEGVAVLLTTHLLDEAETLCDRIGILRAGEIVAQGGMGELRSRVPAQELAVIESTDAGKLRARAAELGLELRDYAGQATLLLPERSAVTSLVERLGEVDARSVALRPVSLLHVYLEVTGAAAGVPPTVEPVGSVTASIGGGRPPANVGADRGDHRGRRPASASGA